MKLFHILKSIIVPILQIEWEFNYSKFRAGFQPPQLDKEGKGCQDKCGSEVELGGGGKGGIV